MAGQYLSFSECLQTLENAAAAFEMFGYSQERVSTAFGAYMKARGAFLTKEFSDEQKNLMLPFIEQLADYFPLVLPTMTSFVIRMEDIHIMTKLSALHLMARDFPDSAEILLYSKQAVAFESHIDKMRNGWYIFADTKAFQTAKYLRNMLASLQMHPCNNCFDLVDELTEFDVEIAVDRAEDEVE